MTHGLRLHDPGQKPGTAEIVLIKIKRKRQKKGPLSVDCDSAAGCTSEVDLFLVPITSAIGTRLAVPRGPPRRWWGGIRKWMGKVGGGVKALLQSCL